MSKGTLVREDWNDISKLTFRDAPLCKIIEVKVIESFIGLKPYPVIVVMNTPVSGIIAKQYTLEGEAESKSKDSEDFQIVKVKEPEPVNKAEARPLTREDWNDISKLTFRDAAHYQIIEIKVLESFVGVKPYPVVVVFRTNTGDLRAVQYTIEGKSEKMVDHFDIVKIKEPERVNYEEIVKELMIKGVFVSQYKKVWYHVSAYNIEHKQFRTFEKWHPLEELTEFYFSFDLFDFYDFKDYLQITGKP